MQQYAFFESGGISERHPLVNVDIDTATYLIECIAEDNGVDISKLKSIASNRPITLATSLFEASCRMGYAVSYESIESAVETLART